MAVPVINSKYVDNNGQHAHHGALMGNVHIGTVVIIIEMGPSTPTKKPNHLSIGSVVC